MAWMFHPPLPYPRRHVTNQEGGSDRRWFNGWKGCQDHCVEEAEDGGYCAGDEYEAAPPAGRGCYAGDEAYQAVDGDLDHDPRHEGGDVRGARRVGVGKPLVERHHARLDPEADEEHDEDDAEGSGVHARREGDRVGPRQRVEGQEPRHQAHRAQLRHREVAAQPYPPPSPRSSSSPTGRRRGT